MQYSSQQLVREEEEERRERTKRGNDRTNERTTERKARNAQQCGVVWCGVEECLLACSRSRLSGCGAPPPLALLSSPALTTYYSTCTYDLGSRRRTSFSSPSSFFPLLRIAKSSKNTLTPATSWLASHACFRSSTGSIARCFSHTLTRIRPVPPSDFRSCLSLFFVEVLVRTYTYTHIHTTRSSCLCKPPPPPTKCCRATTTVQ